MTHEFSQSHPQLKENLPNMYESWSVCMECSFEEGWSCKTKCVSLSLYIYEGLCFAAGVPTCSLGSRSLKFEEKKNRINNGNECLREWDQSSIALDLSTFSNMDWNWSNPHFGLWESFAISKALLQFYCFKADITSSFPRRKPNSKTN